jgi:hypothetical protein
MHKSRFSGTVPVEPGGGLPFRYTWKYESVHPGTLVFAPLGGDLRVTGAASRPFADALVFQADADGLGDRIVVFAATGAGFRFATGTPADDRFEGRTIEGEIAGVDLVSPSVVAIGARAHVAAIAVNATGTRDVVVAQVDG